MSKYISIFIILLIVLVPECKKKGKTLENGIYAKLKMCHQVDQRQSERGYTIQLNISISLTLTRPLGLYQETTQSVKMLNVQKWTWKVKMNVKKDMYHKQRFKY